MIMNDPDGLNSLCYMYLCYLYLYKLMTLETDYYCQGIIHTYCVLIYYVYYLTSRGGTTDF